ncbi:hypothetical protein [Flavobacterium sp.]|uniref:hypothetical protein n=1 Tax=Flavobacterium sp. TaxID=239 RepID=UPI0025DB1AD6|nr:hypothetical protein [Flavobacterium sp.]
MTLESFQNSFENRKRSKKLFNKIICLIAIIGSFLLAYFVFANNKSKSILFLAIWLLILGVYGLIELRKHFGVTCYENNFTEEENIENIISLIQKIAKKNYKQDENSFEFIYQKSWWRMEYKITILATKNLIAINAEGVGSADSGFIDFGAAKKIEKR